ncbi:MAG: ATP-binding cassette domain-containing protein [Rhizobiales bacterium]|nr:ATP-binding cassette domain-containing protein [Hyphomicrobiales bacterium]
MQERARLVDDPADRLGEPSLLPIRVRGLAFEAGGRRLIDGLDLELVAGRLTAIMGPNGAGKSLFLRLLHGLLRPASGRIDWGTTTEDTAPEVNRPAVPLGVRRRQALVFQQPVLLRRSVAANIDFVLTHGGPEALRLADASARRARRDELLSEIGLLERAGQPARLLSGGEQQRLAMARALAVSPDLLLLDEPTASLDPHSTEIIERLVRTAHQGATRVLLVTHDAAQARRLADEVVFIHRGRVAEHSPAHDFFLSPSSAAGRAYLEGRILV